MAEFDQDAARALIAEEIDSMNQQQNIVESEANNANNTDSFVEMENNNINGEQEARFSSANASSETDPDSADAQQQTSNDNQIQDVQHDEPLPERPHSKAQAFLDAAAANYGQPISAGELSEDFLNEIRNVFSLFDHNQDGVIKTEDVGTAIRALGWNITEEHLNDIINETDMDGCGKLDFPQLVHMFETRERKLLPTPEQVKAFFRVFERQRDGLVDGGEVVQMLSELGEPLSKEDIEHLLCEITLDGDNRLNVEQFVNHMFQTSL